MKCQSSRKDFTLRLPIVRRKHQMIIILTNPTSDIEFYVWHGSRADVISWRLKCSDDIGMMSHECWAQGGGGDGGVLRKILTGVCGPGFRNHTLGYGDQGTKSYPWLRKWVKMKPLIVGNITKLTNFEAILHEIG